MAEDASPASRRWRRRDGLRCLTLKFPDASTEEEFVRHSTAGLWSKFFWYGATIFFLSFVFGAMSWLSETRQTVVYPEHRVDELILRVGIVCFGLALLLGSMARRVTRRVGPFALELMAVLVILKAFTLAFAFQLPLLAYLKGYEISGCAHDEELLLNLSCIILTSHVFLKIRWCVTIPTQLYPVLCYALQKYLVDVPECPAVVPLSSVFKVGCLLTMALTAGTGTWMAEVEARELFIRVIREKTHRVEKEFQVEQLQQAAALPSQRREPSLPDSLPTTTSTNRVFELHGESPIGQQLAAVGELGRKEQWLLETAELDWISERILGVGGFGIVTSGTYLGLKVAIKIPKDPPEAHPNPVAIRELCNELRIIRRLTHPNIVSFHGAFVDASFREIALAIELVNGFSLKDFVGTNPNNMDRARTLQEIACALCYLHSQSPRVCHGDLKDTNIYVEQPVEGRWGAVKLLDFGLARQLTKKARPLGGSVAWMAPEAASQNPRLPDTPADVFSWGRVAFFIVTGISPGRGWSRGTLVRQLRQGVAPPLNWPSMDAFSSSYKESIDSCGLSDASLRPTIAAVRQVLAEKRWEYVGRQEQIAWRHEDLSSRLQVVRRAAAKWQRGSADLTPCGNEGLGIDPSRLGIGPPRRSRGSLKALPEEQTAAAAAAPSPGSADAGGAGAGLLHPSLEPTPLQTQASLVLPAMVSCNFEIPAGTCCSYHASVHNLRAVADWLAARRCMPLAEPVTGQCPHCGALAHADSGSDAGVCELCGENLLQGA